MLSLNLKTSLSQGAATSPSSFHHRVPPMMPLPPALVDEASSDQATPNASCGGSSYNSLVDSMSSSTTDNSSSTPSSSCSSSVSTGCLTVGGLKKRPSSKSSYALTSLLSQQMDDSHSSNPTSSLAAAIVAETKALKSISPKEFGESLEVAIRTQGFNPTDNLNFHDNRQIRQVLETPLRRARTMRDSCRRAAAAMGRSTSTPLHHGMDHDNRAFQQPLGSWVGLPYASLREERPFLYDHMHTHPLNTLLANSLNVADLEQLHQTWDPTRETAQEHQRRVFAPLLQRTTRTNFQKAYDSFVTSCCLPLLHTSALRGGVLNGSLNRQHHPSNDPVVYRYQVFPTINVVYPNDPEACVPPSCDLTHGKSVGWLHFHVPLTASQGTSALYCENFPGREDWHALRCTQVGLGYCWDGARCLSFVPLNTTGKTRVSLDFRILLVRASTSASLTNIQSMPSLLSPASRTNSMDDDVLCRAQHLQDALTRVTGFYKEATVDQFGRTATRGLGMAEPDARCGFPFA